MRGKLVNYRNPVAPTSRNTSQMNLATYQAFAMQQRALLHHALTYESLMQSAVVTQARYNECLKSRSVEQILSQICLQQCTFSINYSFISFFNAEQYVEYFHLTSPLSFCSMSLLYQSYRKICFVHQFTSRI